MCRQYRQEEESEIPGCLFKSSSESIPLQLCSQINLLKQKLIIDFFAFQFCCEFIALRENKSNCMRIPMTRYRNVKFKNEDLHGNNSEYDFYCQMECFPSRIRKSVRVGGITRSDLRRSTPSWRFRTLPLEMSV